MACGKYKDLSKRTRSDRVLRDKAFEIASNPKYAEYQGGLASMVYKFLDKISSGSGVMPNQEIVNELRKPIIRRKIKIQKKKSSFII